MAWLVFFASAAVIVAAGARLSREGDEIAERSGLGRLWVGVVLVASATSLPEVFTTASAAVMGNPDLAAGDLFGACLSNMFTLGLIDLLHRQRQVWRQAAFEHTLTAALAMVLVGLAGCFVLLKVNATHAGVGLGSLLLFVLYVLGMRVVFRQEDMTRRAREQERVVEAVTETAEASRRLALHSALLRFGLAAGLLLVAAPLLAWSAGRIAEETGVGSTVIGTSLVAITTSLPELVTAMAAVRLGAYDLAVGNLYGSNAFNMAAFVFVDLAFGGGGIFAAVSSSHAVTALWAILMMNIGLMGIMYRAERRFALVEPDGLLMVVSYGIGLWLLFG